MAVSWQAVRTAAAPALRDADGTNATEQDEGRAREGPEPEPWSEDVGVWPALPREFADGDARRALLRDLALRALI